MLLMRLFRLFEHKQAVLLDAAKIHLAQVERVPVSWNELLEAIQLPRTSAYIYFDGREDLADALIRRVTEHSGISLEQWETVETQEEPWKQ